MFFKKKEKIIYASPEYWRKVWRRRFRKVQKFSSFFSLLAFCTLFFFAVGSGATEPEAIISEFGRLIGKQSQSTSISQPQGFQYKPGEIIVKFKSEISQKIDLNLEPTLEITNQNFFTQNDFFQPINLHFPVEKIEPLIKDVKEKQLKEGKPTAQILEETKQKYPSRFPPKFPQPAPELGNIYKINFKDKKIDVLAMVELFKKHPQVEYAEPNYLVKATQAPNDPLYSQQWALPKIKAPEAWEYLKQLETPAGTGEVFLDQESVSGFQTIKLKDSWDENVSLSFSPKTTGKLAKIEVQIGAWGMGTYTIFTKLTDEAGAQVLAEGSVRVGPSGARPGWIILDLNPKPILTSGQFYKLYLRQSIPWPSFYWRGKNFKLYLEKITFSSQLLPVTVAVIDTGIDYNHEDLKENIWTNQEEIPNNQKDDDNNGFIDDFYGWDFVSYDSNPIDENGHGTHVAGIIGASTNNGLGVASLPPKVKIMSVRILDEYGSGWLSDAINAVYYATRNGALVFNNSWGGRGYSQALEDAFSFAHNCGVVIVAAAGNDNLNFDNNWVFPASSPFVITVAASDENDQKASFSNFGTRIDVAAPGINILSSFLNNSYKKMTGTSMATPYVSSLAVLVKSLKPNFTNEEIRQIIRTSADDILDSGWDVYSGFGRINAKKALEIDSVVATKITSPVDKVRGNIEIKGIVDGANLSEYVLEFAPLSSPNSWREISRGRNPTFGVKILAVFDTSIWADGRYLFKLTAEDKAGNLFSDFAVLEFDNIWISSPKKQALRAGDIIEIKGVAVGSLFQKYLLEYSGEKSKGNWQKICEGTTPIFEGTLCFWNTATISQPDQYQIKLTVFHSNGEKSEDAVSNFLDPAFHAGWPKKFPTIKSSWWYSALDGQPLVADLNNDNKEEILISVSGLFYVTDENGNIFPDWPKPSYRNDMAGSAIVLDLNLDGKNELILPSQGGIRGFNFDSKESKEIFFWPISLDVSKSFISLSGGDIDGDGYKEVVVNVSLLSDPEIFSYLFVFNKEGINLLKNPLVISGYLALTLNLSVGDLENNGRAEIALLANRGYDEPSRLYLIGSEGVLSGWPKDIAPEPFAAPILVDIDKNGELEVIAKGEDTQIRAFKYNGEEILGRWPIKTDDSNGSLSAGWVSQREFPDIFLSGGASASKIFAYNSENAQPLNGWPVSLPWNNFGQPTIVDVDNDGVQDVVVAIPKGLSLYAFKRSGEIINNWPRYLLLINQNIFGNYFMTPAFGDIDGDSKLEMVSGSEDGFVGVWDLETPVSAKKDWPMFGQNPAHTGCLGCERVLTTPTPTPVGPTPTFTPTPTLTPSPTPTWTPTPTPSMVPSPTLSPTPTPTPTPIEPTPTPTPVILTWNAAADYSTIQGHRNWYYQYFDGTNYKDLTYGKTPWGAWMWLEPTTASYSFCGVWNEGQHPGVYEAVRKWVSPVSGKAQITGNVRKGDIGGGDGVRFSIWKNNTKLYEKDLNYNDSVGFNYDLTIDISQNDALYFRIHQRSNNYYDSTIANPTIKVTSLR